MRQFYVYGFKSREEYDQKSPRSYDNERRRIESWLGAYMAFRQDAGDKGKIAAERETPRKRFPVRFLSVDSRAIAHNPLYAAFKAKSFTDRDITLHFFILDALADGECLTAGALLAQIDAYDLPAAPMSFQPDESTLRKKLKEYEALGLLASEKRGREVYYRRSDTPVDLQSWREAIAFFSEANPLGVVGSFLLDKFDTLPDWFNFKHHYLLGALDSEILARLLAAIREARVVAVLVYSPRCGEAREQTVVPLGIRVSTQYGRRYLLGWHVRLGQMALYRLDRILRAEAGEKAENIEACRRWADHFKANLWGASVGAEPSLERLEMTVRLDEGENHIAQRLEREKRCGRVEALDAHALRYTADVYDALELLPWLRTFIGRIAGLECENPAVAKGFFADLEAMRQLYAREIADQSPRGLRTVFPGNAETESPVPWLHRVVSLPAASLPARRVSRSAPQTEAAEMLFSEVYGSYFDAVAAILSEALNGTLTDGRLNEIVSAKGFGESVLSLPAALKSGRWPLLTGDLRTSLKHAPTMPLTTLQKRWLKALLADPRIRLFQPSERGLEAVEPLYAPDVFDYFDQYADGDPYDDPAYIQRFRTVATALREKRKLRLAYMSHRQRAHFFTCVPLRLEYSQKDDKFRLIVAGRCGDTALNLARITECKLRDAYPAELYQPPRKCTQTVILALKNQRNALERAMMHFSHLEKETERLGGDLYRLTLRYDQEDETEMLIRVLSFGPVLRVLAPDGFLLLVKERILRQCALTPVAGE